MSRMVGRLGESALCGTSRIGPGGIRMAAYQQQDPSSVCVKLSLLAPSSRGVCVRSVHGNRLARFRDNLFQKRHLVALQRPKATRLPDRSNNFHSNSRDSPLLSNRQGSDEQSVQCGNPDDPAWTRSYWNWTLHQIFPNKADARNRARADETQKLHYFGSRTKNSGVARCEQVGDYSLNDASDGCQA